MVAPITGPIVETRNGLVGGTWSTYYSLKERYRQAKPYNLSLSYHSIQNKSISNCMSTAIDDRTGTPQANQISPSGGDETRHLDCANKALEEFRSNISDSVGLGIDLAQYGQSLEMVAARVKQIHDFAGALRRGDVSAASRALSTKPPKGFRAKGKSFGNMFLEWHFGWSPLLSDIYDAAATISDPIHNVRCKGTSHDNWVYNYFRNAGSGFLDKEFYAYTLDCKVGADVYITNPNLHLAQSLGLLNPLSIAWDAVPYSFVVDWFVNIGGYLGSLGQFAGLGFERPYTTFCYKVRGSTLYTNPYWTVNAVTTSFSGIEVSRSPTLPSTTIVLNPHILPSPTRAITAISLLLQKL